MLLDASLTCYVRGNVLAFS